MKILVINCGSSSLKYQLINMEDNHVLASGKCDRIGVKSIDSPYIEYKKNGKKISEEVALPNHTVAFELIMKYLLDPEVGVIKDVSEIDAIGHRIVHGGPQFTKTTVVTDEVLKEYNTSIEYAPLHNPAHLQGINACMKLMPGTPEVLVFDTSFHTTIPDYAALYAIPYEYYEKYKVRRYGFHGTSHSFVSKRAAELLGKAYDETKTIVCHLGNGSSVTAVLNGKSVDTSMGLTPLEGLVMGTRCGDIDPAIMEFLAHKLDLDVDGVMKILNKDSGVYGLSGGLSSDFRDLTDASLAGDKKAQIAMEVFSYRVAKYIGAYVAVMNGVDDIVFTAGIGENDDIVREQVCSYLGYLGIEFNTELNKGLRGKETELSMPGSKVKVFVIPTNEELAIARETLELVRK